MSSTPDFHTAVRSWKARDMANVLHSKLWPAYILHRARSTLGQVFSYPGLLHLNGPCRLSLVEKRPCSFSRWGSQLLSELSVLFLSPNLENPPSIAISWLWMSSIIRHHNAKTRNKTTSSPWLDSIVIWTIVFWAQNVSSCRRALRLLCVDINGLFLSRHKY
jgi:hypothetical protein